MRSVQRGAIRAVQCAFGTRTVATTDTLETIMTTFTGERGVSTYRACVIKSALQLYAKTGMKANRAYTPTAMLAAASDITGLKFRRGQYQQAADAIGAWLEKFGSNK